MNCGQGCLFLPGDISKTRSLISVCLLVQRAKSGAANPSGACDSLYGFAAGLTNSAVSGFVLNFISSIV
jgi:hypothetical protein